MKSRIVALFALVSLVVVGTLVAEDAAKVDWAKIKCVVSGKPVNVEKKAEFKGAEVYFCCPGCAASYAKDATKFTAKSNHQLVATGQAKQEGCPMSGKPVKADAKVSIGGVDVAFCCNNCKGAAEKMAADEQVSKVFGDEAFAKAFKVSKK